MSDLNRPSRPSNTNNKRRLSSQASKDGAPRKVVRRSSAPNSGNRSVPARRRVAPADKTKKDSTTPDGFKKINKTVIVRDKEGNERKVVREFLVGPDGKIVRQDPKKKVMRPPGSKPEQAAPKTAPISVKKESVKEPVKAREHDGGLRRTSSVNRREDGELRRSSSNIRRTESGDSSLKTKSVKEIASDVLADRKKAYRRSTEKPDFQTKKSNKGILIIALFAALIVAGGGGYFYIDQQNKAYVNKYHENFASIKNIINKEVIETSRTNLSALEAYKNARSTLFSNIETNSINDVRKSLKAIEDRILVTQAFKKSSDELKANEDTIPNMIADFEELKKSNKGVSHTKLQELEKEISDALVLKYKKVWKEKSELINEIVGKNINDFMYKESIKYLTDEKENFGKISFGEDSVLVNAEMDKLIAKVEKNKIVYNEFADKLATIKGGNITEIRSGLKDIQEQVSKIDPEFQYIHDWVLEKSERIAENTMHLYRAEYKGFLESGALKPESVFIKENDLKKKEDLPDFVDAKEDELVKLATFFSSGLPGNPEYKIEGATDTFKIPYDDNVIIGGFVQDGNVRSILLYFKGFSLQLLPTELNTKTMPKGGAISQYHMNFFIKGAYKYLLNPPEKEGRILWFKNSGVSLKTPGFVLFGKAGFNSYVMVNDIVYEQKNKVIDVEAQKKEINTFKSALEKLISEINKSYSDRKEIANPVTLLLEGLLKNIDGNHHISPQFSNLALKSGYLLNILPKPSDELCKLINEVEKMYNESIDIGRVIWSGEASDGSEVTMTNTYTGKIIYRIYDATRDETIFMGKPYVTEIQMAYSDTSYSVVSKGNVSKWPKPADIIRYETYHFNGERLAVYDTKTQKFIVDTAAWEQNIMDPRNIYPMYGTATWRHPPHILMLSAELGVEGVIVPGGTVTLFQNTGDAKDANKLMDDWLADVAKKMPLAGELHLLFKYLMKYTFDSPIPNMNNLIGNNRDRGDFHQTVYQTLERRLGDKMLCDCDDLAEVYANIIKRQNKNSFVFGVPGHATCGWVEKTDDGKFAMNFLDTGIPRRFVANTLDEAIKQGVDSYDNQNTVDFNPRSVHFLLRFAGEQVRQNYFLDSKVLIDDAYGEKMVDVQEGWHFHYYLQSLKIMEGIVKKDPMPANFFEIAGLHRQMGDFKSAAKIFKAGLDKLDTNDKKGYLQNFIMYSGMLFKADKTKIPEYIVAVQKLMADMENTHAKDLLHQRFNLANILLSEKKGVEAYRLIKDDLKSVKNINMGFVGTLISIVKTINDKKEQQTEEEKGIVATMNKMVNAFTRDNLFTAQDDIRTNIFKYSTIYSSEIGENGLDESLKKLLVKEYPKNIDLKHFDRRKANVEEDWKWIRLNIQNYYGAMLNELKVEEKDSTPTEEQWQKAFQVNEYLESAYAELKKHGVNTNFEYTYLMIQLFQAAKKKEWAKVDEIFDRMQKEEWTVFYRMVANQVGALSVFLPKEQFMVLVKKFFDHKPPKQHFLEIVYDCLTTGKKDYCLDVAKLVLKYFPNDEKISKEVELLEPYLKSRVE